MMQIAKFAAVLALIGASYAYFIFPMLPESARGGSLPMSLAVGFLISMAQLYIITRLIGMHV